MLLDKEQSGDTGKSFSYCLNIKYTQLTAPSIALSSLSPPTARPAPAPQSLRRLFHDESSTDPDPFQFFAHQQPPTPQTTEGSSTIKQTGRFPSPEQSDLPPLDNSSSPPQTPSKRNEFDGQTIRQARLGRDERSPTPLMVNTDYPPSSCSTPSAMPTATYHPAQTSQEPTPIARTDHTTVTTATAAAVPSPRRIQNKTSLDNLSLTPTSKTQPAMEERSKSSGGMRRPSASDARDGLRGFQFPLMTKSGPGPTTTTTATAASSSSTQAPSSGKLFPPSLNRNHSASPAFPFADPQATTTTTTTTAAASPTGTSSPGFGGIALGPRPPMMRQASVAVMEGRAASQSQSQAQAQALALALAQTQAQQLLQQQQQGPASPPTPKKTVALAVPSPIGLGRPGMSASTSTAAAGGASGVGGGGQGMMIRSRSGSKAEDGHPVGLRDLLKVGPFQFFFFSKI